MAILKGDDQSPRSALKTCLTNVNDSINNVLTATEIRAGWRGDGSNVRMVKSVCRRDLVLLCSSATALFLSSCAHAAAPQFTPGQAVSFQDGRQRLLDIHNQQRARFGYKPLVWDARLAASASAYANHLARTGRLVHSPREGRGTVRENLSQGLLGWNTDQLTQAWLNERKNFRPGLFPYISSTGNWYHVSHYSQMIWPTTTHVGCGTAVGSGFTWLVCHYDPGGNSDGVLIGAPK